MTAAYPGQARHAQVVHALGAAIVRGELGPGRPVPTEDELVSRFAVGRSALREGVKVLAGKGLLGEPDQRGHPGPAPRVVEPARPGRAALAVFAAGQPG